MPALLDLLPPIYRTLLPATFDRHTPVEAKATCSSCAMCPEEPSRSGQQVAPSDGVSRLFRPDVKCCTFHPDLPNYLVGAILADEDPALAEGRRRIRERIASRIAVDPLGVRPPARYSVLYDISRRSFGRSAALRCPYFEERGGDCTIWRWREAICSTYFCKYVSGADGRAFWAQLKTYLALVESVLSRHAVFGLHPAYLLAGHHRTESAVTLGLADLDETPPPSNEYAARWGAWEGREEAYYRSCTDGVRALSPDDVTRIIGIDGAIELAVLDKLHRAACEPLLPEVLQLNPMAIVKWLPDGSVRLGAYSDYDAVVVPGATYSLLAAFTGEEPVGPLRARLRAERHADLDDDLLLRLFRHRVLVAV